MFNLTARRQRKILRKLRQEYEDLLLQPHYRKRLKCFKDMKLLYDKAARTHNSFYDNYTFKYISAREKYKQYSIVGDCYVSYLETNGYTTCYIAIQGSNGRDVPVGHRNSGNLNTMLIITKTGFHDQIDTLLANLEEVTEDWLTSMILLYYKRPDLFTEIQYDKDDWKKLKESFSYSNSSLAHYMLKDHA